MWRNVFQPNVRHTIAHTAHSPRALHFSVLEWSAKRSKAEPRVRDDVLISFEFALAYYFVRGEIFTHRIVADVSLNGIPPVKLTHRALRTCNEKNCTDASNIQYHVRIILKRQLKSIQ